MKIGNNFAFRKAYEEVVNIDYEHEFATAKGIGIKTSILLGITFLTSLVLIALTTIFGIITLAFYIVGGIAGIILQIIMNLNPRKAKSLSIPYAICEGLTVGCLCGILAAAFGDVGLQIASIALLATLAIFLASTFLYSRGIIRVNNRFRSFLLVISLGIIILSLGFGLLSLIVFLTSGQNLYTLYYFSGFGLLGAIIMCIVATMYVIFSFSVADNLIEAGADKDMEWYAAYAITLNVVYLFIEILRLLLILFSRQSRD